MATTSFNALCVNANRTELAPIVYETWPNSREFSTSNLSILGFWPSGAFENGTVTYNRTVLDAIFDWRDDESRTDHIPPSKACTAHHYMLIWS